MIGIDHLTVASLFPLIIHIKTVSIFHDEFTGTHPPETGPNLIPELGLNLIEVEGHLAVGTDLPASDIRDYLFMSRPKTTVSIVAILEPGQLFSILFPPMAFLPELGRLDHGKQNLNGSGPIHLFTNDRLHLSYGSQAERQIGIDARSQFTDPPCPEHQLVARDFRLGRNLLQGRKKIFRIPHLNSSFKTCQTFLIFLSF